MLFVLRTIALALAPASAPACTFGDVAFTADFDGARLSECRQTSDDEYEIAVAPENTPINPSPWYAFDVETEAARRIGVTLRYSHGRHRYQPKTRSRDGVWRPITEVAVADDGGSATFALDLDAGVVTVAAQPLIDADAYDAWLDTAGGLDGVKRITIGKSEEGRTIEAIVTAPARRSVIFIGRQHPPETTGAEAFFAFVDRVLADDPLAKEFRRRYRVLAIPMLNPDGVAHGHWRHNIRGIDLNRDWGPFAQAETRAARRAIEKFAGKRPGRLALLLDFHSTKKDVLYTQTDDANGSRPWFAGAWRAAIAGEIESAPERDASHNPDLPTAKTWVHETYAAPAITFELGDDASSEDIERLAVVAAETAMRLLLSDGPPE